MCGNCVKLKDVKLYIPWKSYLSHAKRALAICGRFKTRITGRAVGEHVQRSFAKTLPFDRLGASGARRDERENRGDEACMEGRVRISYSTAKGEFSVSVKIKQ